MCPARPQPTRPQRTPRPPLANHRGALLAAIAGLTLLLAPSSDAGAELAILAGGEVLKIESYELRGDRMRLGLKAGGFLTLPMSRIANIVDDEISPDPPPAPPPPEPAFQLGFQRELVVETPYSDLFVATGQQYELNPNLLAAMARAESAYQPTAVSHKGAIGLMQLMPATAERFGIEVHELDDPARNLQAAARYLVWLRKRFADELPLVLAAYNAGEGSVDRYDGIPPYRETQDYVAKIYRFLGLDAHEASSAN